MVLANLCVRCQLFCKLLENMHIILSAVLCGFVSQEKEGGKHKKDRKKKSRKEKEEEEEEEDEDGEYTHTG